MQYKKGNFKGQYWIYTDDAAVPLADPNIDPDSLSDEAAFGLGMWYPKVKEHCRIGDYTLALAYDGRIYVAEAGSELSEAISFWEYVAFMETLTARMSGREPSAQSTVTYIKDVATWADPDNIIWLSEKPTAPHPLLPAIVNKEARDTENSAS